MIGSRRRARCAAGELARGLIRLKAKGGTVWEELLTSTRQLAAAEYFAAGLAAEGTDER